MNLTELISANSYKSEFEICPGCENHCTVKLFHFQNGNTFFSGNNCEKVYSNTSASQRKGTNMFAEKYRLLFQKPDKVIPTDAMTIGIPRGLGIYENYPFWRTLFSECGIRPVLSNASGNKLYESGLRSIMADNICFPAKLMHGHINDLIAKKVDRIFYPYVVYERKEDEQSRNSYNCPIVAGYSDVIKSSMEPATKAGIPFDAPVIAFNNSKLLYKSCMGYLESLGVERTTADHAVKAAVRAQDDYLNTLTRRGNEILEQAVSENRMVILLAGRPYHIDPLIEHKISHAIADMGIDVITENTASELGANVYRELNAMTQWSYPNRIFKAAYFVGQHNYRNLHLVQLTSFGCGPDAFILDEVNAILKRFHKNHTILKIDDVNNIGSLRLRVRSLVESVSGDTANANLTDENGKNVPLPYVTTRTYTKAERRRTLLAPYFAEGYSEFFPSIFKVAGYNLITLPTGSQEAAEIGLKYANNEVCYPATIVVGSVMKALLSGEYNPDEVAVIMSQTGGQCRASSYYSLIKNALVTAGLQDIPVISLALSASVSATQPGFTIPWRKVLNIAFTTVIYADCLAKLYHASVVREKEPGMAKKLKTKYTELACPIIEANDSNGLQRLMGEAVREFAAAVDTKKQVPVIGVVGEIYVKYNGFSNKFVINWLEEHGVEVVPPALIGFLTTGFVNNHLNRELNIKEVKFSGWLNDVVYKLLFKKIRQFNTICAPFPFYRPLTSVFEDAALAKQVVNMAGDFGEGWFLPGEICHLAENGIHNVVSLQPFGCIANHIISKGVEKKLKQVYPQLNLLFLDFDSGTSEANVFNRLHFMVENCKKALKHNSDATPKQP
ncbi:MAG: acyl-CoA dehydratase activase-related protein [Bacteroidales bacterium]|nr:acyl-CoA dehydratase activase-related protein [Bacteroidales bacterium]